MLDATEHDDYQYGAFYGAKYVQLAKSQGVLNEDYLTFHKSLVWPQLNEHMFDDAFKEASSVYQESKQLGHSEEESLQMIHTTYDENPMNLIIDSRNQSRMEEYVKQGEMTPELLAARNEDRKFDIEDILGRDIKDATVLKDLGCKRTDMLP